MEIIYMMLDGIDFEEYKEYISLLPPERQAKTARYRFPKDKLLSLGAGLLIRQYVGERRIYRAEHEKPYMEGDIFFSVSHSERCVAIATDRVEVGLDVEILPDDKKLRVAERFFHPGELSYVMNADDRYSALCRIWTRKEAYLKETGIGISTDLRGFDTTAPPLSDKILSYDLGGYVLSVCSADRLSEDEIHISKIELNELVSFIR